MNTIGDISSRASFKKELAAWLTKDSVFRQLSEDDQKRCTSNPLRVLDSKHFQQLNFGDEVPRIDPYLSADSRSTFQDILLGLDSLGVRYKVNPSLVRGLDYYNDFCFEVKPQAPGSNKQSTLLAGGRYDNLMGAIAKDQRKNVSAVGLKPVHLQVRHGNRTSLE